MTCVVSNVYNNFTNTHQYLDFLKSQKSTVKEYKNASSLNYYCVTGISHLVLIII